jgi:hypothetical protein
MGDTALGVGTSMCALCCNTIWQPHRSQLILVMAAHHHHRNTGTPPPLLCKSKETYEYDWQEEQQQQQQYPCAHQQQQQVPIHPRTHCVMLTSTIISQSAIVIPFHTADVNSSRHIHVAMLLLGVGCTINHRQNMSGALVRCLDTVQSAPIGVLSKCSTMQCHTVSSYTCSNSTARKIDASCRSQQSQGCSESGAGCSACSDDTTHVRAACKSRKRVVAEVYHRFNDQRL